MIDFVMANAVFGDNVETTVSKMMTEQKPIGFCYDQDGQLYKLTKNPMGVTVNKVENTIFAGDDAKPVKEGFIFTLPKIPLKLLNQIISFFKDVCDDSGNEVFARIYFDKENQEYLAFVPKQTISKANVTYNITDERFQTEDRYLFVLDIHSHNTMSAFFSGTDNADERTSGKVYMVVGELDKENIKYKIRTYQEPTHVEIDLFDVFEKPNVSTELVTEYGTFSFEVPDEKLIKNILCKVEEYPDEWPEQITRRTYTNYPSFSSSNSNNRYSYWDDYYKNGQLSLFDRDEDDRKFPSIKKHIEENVPEVDEMDFDTPTDLNMSPEEKYYFAKEDIAQTIADALDEVGNLEDINILTGLKDGLVELGLEHVLKSISEME